MSDFVQQNSNVCSFDTNSSWVVLSPVEMSIKRKVESMGVPLRDWNIQIYRGILTGLNKAFIISSDKRDEILNNCITEEERTRTDEVIRPILRGKDIKKYGYNWKGLYLINFHNGLPAKSISALNIKDFPSLKNHFDYYYKELKKREDQGITPYNLRSCAYLDVLTQPKIIFQEIVQSSQFAFDSKGEFCCNDTCRMITGDNLLHLLGVLNSNLFFFAIKKFYGGGGLGESGVRMKHTFFNEFHCVLPSDEIEKLVTEILSTNETCMHYNNVSKLNEIIYKEYGLNADEIKYIEANR